MVRGFSAARIAIDPLGDRLRRRRPVAGGQPVAAGERRGAEGCLGGIAAEAVGHRAWRRSQERSEAAIAGGGFDPGDLLT